MANKHWKTLSLILFMVLCIPLTACGGGGEDGGTKPSGKALSFEEASQLVIDQVIIPDQLDHRLILFGSPQILTPEDELNVYAADDLSKPGENLPLTAESWFFWVDDAPYALFTHPTRYVLVNAQSGEITTSNEGWWPVLNGKSLWVEDDQYHDQENWIYSNIENRSDADESHQPGLKAALVADPSLLQQESSSTVGLVVNGWSTGQGAESDLNESQQQMERLLDKSGFDVTSVDSGDADPKQKVEDWINDEAANLQPGDTVVIYLTGHGANNNGTGGLAVGDEDLTETELVGWLGDVHPGVHTIVILDTCHSGAWRDGLENVADVNLTSTGPDIPAYADTDNPNDPNPRDMGIEYTSGLVEDWNQFLEIPTQTELAEDQASANGTGYWVEVTWISHVSAAAKDCNALEGITTPEAVRGNPFFTQDNPISPFLYYVNADQTLTMDFLSNLQEDGTGDGHVSTKQWDILADVNAVGINWTTAFVMAFSPEARDEWYGHTYFECGTQVGDVLTFCAPDAGPMPEGDELIGLMVLDADIPLDPGEDIYQYGFVLDSDNDPANDFQAQPPYTLDYFQGTDLWYVVYYHDGWQLDASTSTGSQVDSNARAAIIKNILVYFIPADEYSAEFPAYRFSAFGCADGGWGSGFCNGDTSGIDATYPPVPVPQEKISISE